MSYRPITDLWMLCRSKVGNYYGAYPSGFLERARALLGVTINDPVLHVCGGRVKDYQSGPMKGKGLGPNDRTVDLDPELEPDFLLDARRIGVSPGDVFPYWEAGDPQACGMFDVTKEGDGPFAYGKRQPWYGVLLDRPYTETDAAEYAVGAEVFPSNINDLLRRCLSVTRIGGRVGVLDYVFPRPPREGVRLVALIGVSTGWNNRARWFSVFERVAHNPLEFNVTGECTEDEEMAATIPESGAEDFASPSPAVRIDTAKKTKKKIRAKKKKVTGAAASKKIKAKRKGRPSVMDGFN